jgi:hypothetical protein
VPEASKHSGPAPPLSASTPFGVPSGPKRAMTLGVPTLASRSPRSKPAAVADCAQTAARTTATMAQRRIPHSQRPTGRRPFAGPR